MSKDDTREVVEMAMTIHDLPMYDKAMLTGFIQGLAAKNAIAEGSTVMTAGAPAC